MTGMAGKSDTARYAANLKEERNALLLYERMARSEPKADLASLYRRLADTERKHAAVW